MRSVIVLDADERRQTVHITLIYSASIKVAGFIPPRIIGPVIDDTEEFIKKLGILVYEISDDLFALNIRKSFKRIFHA